MGMVKKERANRDMEEALKKTVLNCASNKIDVRILKNIDANFTQTTNKNKKLRKK